MHGIAVNSIHGLRRFPYFGSQAVGVGPRRSCLPTVGWKRGLVLLCISFCCYTTIIYHWRKFVGVLELICLSKKYFFTKLSQKLGFLLNLNRISIAGQATKRVHDRSLRDSEIIDIVYADNFSDIPSDCELGLSDVESDSECEFDYDISGKRKRHRVLDISSDRIRL